MRCTCNCSSSRISALDAAADDIMAFSWVCDLSCVKLDELNCHDQILASDTLLIDLVMSISIEVG